LWGYHKDGDETYNSMLLWDTTVQWGGVARDQYDKIPRSVRRVPARARFFLPARTCVILDDSQGLLLWNQGHCL